MPNSLPRSFRRLLVFRLLVLGIPILLIGQYFTLRKARTGLLETARQNLASSAVRKAEFLRQSSDTLANQVGILTQTQALQNDELSEKQDLLAQFSMQKSLSASCMQLLEAQTNTIVASTCSNDAPIPETALAWPQTVSDGHTPFALVEVTSDKMVALPETDPDRHAKVEMAWAAPVYGPDQSLRYTLVLRNKLSQLENIDARSLVGYTVLIDATNQIVVHPNASLQGEFIDDLGEADRLANIVRNARAGRQATLHLFQFLPSYGEWLAGYSSLEVEVAPDTYETWVVLAVTPLEHALQGLADIRNVLVVFTLGLLVAEVALVLYLAQRLSRPIERLCQYAKEIQDLSQLKEVPQNFQVWELNHLAKVFNKMIKRLEQRAQDLQHAWQDAQIANRLKSEFLANTSHELRTPLNAIIGCVRLVKDDCCDSPEEISEFLETADQAAIHLLGVINDILDIAKIEAGTLEVNPTTVDMRQVVDEVITLQSLQIRQKGLNLRCARSDKALWIVADPAKLRQVLLNIVYNATKFTDSGEIAIDTYLETDSSSKRAAWPDSVSLATPLPRVIVSVIDTGVGIALAQQEKLFQPFVMADGSTTRQHQGTGLGLSISRNLINLMGGSIALYSQGVGHGTQVVFALPYVSHQETLSEGSMAIATNHNSATIDDSLGLTHKDASRPDETIKKADSQRQKSESQV